MNTITSSSDETYLEAYIEQLTTSQWTYQVRRTMDLIRDLDTVCANDLQQLHHLTQQLHTHMEDTVIQNFDIVELKDDENNEIPEDDVPDEIDELFGWNNNKNNNNSNKSGLKDNSNKKRKRPQYGMRLVVGDNKTDTNEAPAMIPTTEELFEYVLQQPVPSTSTTTTPSIAASTTTTTTTSTTPSLTSTTNTLKDIYQQIQDLQQNCIQKSHEKVYVAQQAYEMIDAQVQRLDNDIHHMELLLQSTGEFPRPTMGINTNSNPHQQQQPLSQQHQSSAVSSNMSNHTNVNHTSSSTTTTTTAFRTATPQMVTPLSSTASLAACQVTPGSEYILCKILLHDIIHKTYKLADEDIESNKIFDLPESQVIVLNPIERLNKGDIIYAVYPDTTSFYQATVVVSTNKKTSANTNAAQQQILPKQPPYVMVQFVDDADEFGITHDKAVPIQHVMIPPPQLLL